MKFPAVVTATIVASLPFSVSAEERRGDNPEAKPLSPAEQLKRFKVPPGFEVQLVAAEPEIQKPVNLNFDSSGRVWMTGSEMYPWPAATDALGKPLPGFEKAYEDIASAFGSKGKAPGIVPEGRDTVRILSNFAPDGRARKIETFADKLNIPTGIQPLPRKPGAKGDAAIVYSIPSIWRFEDTDGDGKTDKREPLYEGFGYLDTHGMSSNYIYWIDGWIYGCHGFRNHSEVRDRSGNVTVFDSGNTYRFKPDGSKIEYWTHGQTNPFGLTFDPFGNLYSADSHSKPVYMLLRGGYYEGIGKKHDGLGFAPRITDDDHGSSAIAGIMYYTDDKWPAEYHGNLFNGNPVTQRVNRAKLDWQGSTPKATRVADFVTCDDPWFRPVQVKLGPDGALYIADFYNPIIGHYEVPLSDPRRDRTHGRIWRVVWRGESGNQAITQTPNLGGLNAQELIPMLDSRNLEVARIATNELVDRIGKEAIKPLQNVLPHNSAPVASDGFDAPVTAPHFANRLSTLRGNALWAYHRIAGSDASLPLQPISSHSEQGSHLRLQAIRILAERNDLADSTLNSLRHEIATAHKAPAKGIVDAIARREISSLQGRLNTPDHLEILLGVLDAAAKEDSELIHTARMALRNTLMSPSGYAIATKLLQHSPNHAEILAEVSLGAATPEAAEFLLTHLQRTKLNTPRAGDYLRHVALNIAPERLSGIIEAVEALDSVPLTQRLAAADGLNEAVRRRGLTLPENAKIWMQRAMIEALGSSDAAIVDRAIATVRDANLEAKYEPLKKIVTDVKGHGPRRAAALDALMNLERSREILISSLNDPSSMTLRKRAAELLGQTNTKEANDALYVALQSAPKELATIIAGSLAKTDDGLNALLGAIQIGHVSPRVLLNKAVSGAVEKRSGSLRKIAATLTDNLPPEDARLDQVITQRVNDFRSAHPNSAHGQQLFQQQCAACHKMKNVGGNIGPNLDGVGSRGVHRLIEDILDPNRNVDPAFRQTVIETADGRTLAGVNFRTEGELVMLNDAEGKEVSVPKAQVRLQNQSTLSLMPPTFEQTLNSNDLSDLVAYLIGQSETVK